jgi:hypothetical protein
MYNFLVDHLCPRFPLLKPLELGAVPFASSPFASSSTVVDVITCFKNPARRGQSHRLPN